MFVHLLIKSTEVSLPAQELRADPEVIMEAMHQDAQVEKSGSHLEDHPSLQVVNGTMVNKSS